MWRSAALIGAVLALGSWIILCLVAQTSRIEEALRLETERMLATAELGDVRAMVDGRNVALEGLVASSDQKAEAQRLVGGVSGIRRIDNRLNLHDGTERLPEPVLATYLEISMRQGGLSMRGGVPSEALRLEIVEQARLLFDSDRIEERLLVDTVAEDGAALAGAAGVIRVLAEVGMASAEVDVRVRLQGDSLRVSGAVAGEPARQRLEARIRAAVPGVRLFFSTLSVSDPWPARRDEGEG